MRQINEAGLDLIKSFEGLRLSPYQDMNGIWTIGYGHTKGVSGSSKTITVTQAESLLRNDLVNAETSVGKLIKVTLTDNQYAALVSLVFNVGSAPLTHTLGTKLNAGDIDGAAEEFLKWNHAGGTVVAGLARRREAEQALFSS